MLPLTQERLRHWDDETARREIDRELARRDVPHCRMYVYQPHALGGYAGTCLPGGQRGLSYHVRP